MKKEESIDKRALAEYKRLSRLFADIDEKKRKIVDGLMRRAAFMKATLEDLEKKISDEDVLDLFKQGEYEYYREHPALKSYNTTIKNYSSVIKQLTELRPKEESRGGDDDGFENYASDREDL
ncbi:hypothetical protein MUJ63_08000 [Lachnospiraceae bacterium NSJ-143]|nr:hypothetical protein [Lachnospiraceae bacterium NSJ-143]